jgi:group I intron endonuclease
MKGIIYCIENLENGKRYVGQTTRDLVERFREHCGNGGTSVSPKLKNAIKKYGKDCFCVEILWEIDSCVQDELNKKEIEFIENFNTMHPNGYNLTYGGLGGRHSNETKKLLSEKSKRMWETRREEMVEKRRKQWTIERRQELSRTLKQGYIDNPERRQLVSSRWRSALPFESAVLASDVSSLQGEARESVFNSNNNNN